MDDELFEEALGEIEELPTGGPMFLYVFYAEGTHWIKIGITDNIEARRKALQTGCPPMLRLLFSTPCINSPDLEQLMHDHFSPYQLQGEWFTLPPDVPTVLDLLSFVFKHSQPTPSFHGPISRLQKLTIVEERIVQALSPSQPIGIPTLMGIIGASGDQYGYIRKLLVSMTKKGIVARFSHGKYCLPIPGDDDEYQSSL